MRFQEDNHLCRRNNGNYYIFGFESPVAITYSKGLRYQSQYITKKSSFHHRLWRKPGPTKEGRRALRHV